MSSIRVRTALVVAALSFVAQISAAQDHASARVQLGNALTAASAANGGTKLPDAAAFTFGDRTIAAGAPTAGPVAVAEGTLHVRGPVTGDVVTYSGNIIVHSGGSVSGSAIAIGGTVTLDGGRVDGETRAIGGNLAPLAGDVAAARTGIDAVIHQAALAGGWLGVMLIVGLSVLVFASRNLDAVGDALTNNFGRSFIAGLAGEVALLPVLALITVGLTLTVLGILLIPFAIVAYVVALAGLVTLGYLAIARLTGATVVKSPGGDDKAARAAALKAMIVGLIVLMVPWFLASALAGWPMAALAARAIAVAITWVAATAGLGAALVSRGGVRRAVAPAAQRAMQAASWATPTPVAGVVAARRPTPYSTTVPK